ADGTFSNQRAFLKRRDEPKTQWKDPMGHRDRNLSGLLSAVLIAGLAVAPAAAAQECETCGKGACPPFYKHHYEAAPKIKFKRACPRPICNPCHLPHYGYFPTCWHPWPFPRNECACPPEQPDILFRQGENPGMPRSSLPSDIIPPTGPPIPATRVNLEVAPLL